MLTRRLMRMIAVGLELLILLAIFHAGLNETVQPDSRFRPLAGVILTTGKDTRVFEKSILSALKYLIDIDTFYIITPDADYLIQKFQKRSEFSPHRLKFIDERIFPFKYENVTDIMYRAVKDRGIYPLTGHSSFERTIGAKTGWFLQQILKLYAGKVLGLQDFLLLDSDVIWFQNITFYNNTNREEIAAFHSRQKSPPPNFMIRYNYGSSGQYHPPYMASMRRIIQLDPFEDPKDVFRSGIVHHMVIVKEVVEAMMSEVESRYGQTMPFWQILLNQSAIEMTCKGGRDGICGAGSTLSEYEMYFTYARHRYPQTVAFRPLLWANGPAPGLLFWPPLDFTRIHPDKAKTNFMPHRQADVMKAFEQQIASDALQGYDYVGYHSYAKRRYYEMVQPDYLSKCQEVAIPLNTTCSWRGFDVRAPGRTAEDWFRGCACYMIGH